MLTMHRTSYLALLMLFAMARGTVARAQVVENHNSEVARNLEIFNEIYKALDLYYVDSLSADTVIRSAIDGMLHVVDPYTGYYPADNDDLRVMATGKYGGIGNVVRFHKGQNRVVIDEIYENTPSQEVGLRAGDIILTIDGKDILGLSPSIVTPQLRGEPGTTFELTFQRPGEKEPRKVLLTRKTIQFPAIPYSGIIDSGIGYINLSSFTSNCAREMRSVVLQLLSQGVTGLVVDLRDNGGGAVNEAVDIANIFLPKGIQVVSTKGKQASMNHSYNTTTDPVAPDIPLVVLVNGMSASSSEILCGSLQDMDRAVVMGTPTFGKGLVQSIRDVPYRGELKITTGRYYIPSGRCIQAHEYTHDGKSKTIPDSLRNAFYTKAGRLVLDGGGIQPDITIVNDTLPTMVYDLVESDKFFDWASDFVIGHPSIAEPGDFVVDDSLYSDFCRYIESSDFKYNRRSDEVIALLRNVARMEGYLEYAEDEMKALEEKFAPNLSRDLQRMKERILPFLESEIVSRYYFQRGSIRQYLKSDKTYRAAVDLLRDKEAYRDVLTVKGDVSNKK